MQPKRTRPIAVLLLLVLSLFPALAQLVGAGQDQSLQLKALLIWGTDEAKPKDKDLKDVDTKLHERLAKVFKWKNYFQVCEKKLALPRKETKRLQMSSKCEIELRFVDDATIEVKLFGEGKHTGTLRKQIKALERGELSVLAGDDKYKYGDAWFVVISSDKP